MHGPDPTSVTVVATSFKFYVEPANGTGYSNLCRANIQENIELIKLQRELREKSSSLTLLHDKYTGLEEVSLVLYSGLCKKNKRT